jgi:hypothetical protein
MKKYLSYFIPHASYYLPHTSYFILRTSFIILLTSCLILQIGCRERIDVKLDSTYARLVVEGYLTTDTTRHLVRLSKSGDALNTQPVQHISNAVVSVTDGNNVFVLNEDINNKGNYYTDSTVYGVPGRKYTLNISNVDIDNDGISENYTASSMLKNEDPVDSIHVLYDPEGAAGKGWDINLFARDIGGGRNFYLLKVYKNNVLLTDSAHKLTAIADNTGFEGGYYNGFTAYFLREDRKDEKVSPGDIITLEMDGITQEYYQFLMDFVQEYYPKVPIFSGPSANISTNILPKDKACGFFAVYSVSRKSRVYK